MTITTMTLLYLVYFLLKMSEAKMKEAAKTAVASSSDPLEKLRNHCLSQGYSGVLSLGR